MTAQSYVRQWLSRSIGIAIVIAATLTLITPAFAEDANVKLSIKPVGEDSGTYFTVTATPGETVQLEVELRNEGSAPIAATTFAADTFTMPNGGFGIQSKDAEQTATTQWITYPTETLDLQPGESNIRSFPLTIPVDATPGDYLTSLVIQNANPIQGDGAVALNQIVRQAVAISVDVPGERTHALAISGVHHEASGTNSVFTFDVGNTGNTHLKPVGEFALTDASGVEIDQRPVAMDRFYSGTRTTLAVALDRLLAPGDYFASLTLTDPTSGATAQIEEAPFTVPVVEIPAVVNPDGSVAEPARTNAPVSESQGTSKALIIGIAAVCLIVGMVTMFVVMRLRARRAIALALAEAPIAQRVISVTEPEATRYANVKPLILRSTGCQQAPQTSTVPSTLGSDAQ